MKYNRDIFIDEHACERFTERFNLVKAKGNLEDTMKAAERMLKEIFSGASYMSDDAEGILFRNKEFDCDMIVQYRHMVTVFHPRSKRELKMDSSALEAVNDKRRRHRSVKLPQVPFVAGGLLREHAHEGANGNDISKPDAHIPPHMLHSRRGRRF